MAFVTELQLQEYTGNKEDSTLNTVYLEMAEEVVKDYLGYDPILKEYSEYFSGIEDYRVYLNAQPVAAIFSITIDGIIQNVDNFSIGNSFIYKTDREEVFTSGINNIKVEFSAGYDEYEVPGIIVLTVLRVASLLLQEAGGNIGITGKSFGDNSRSFINYADYKKYLKPLDNLKVLKV